MQQEPDVRIVLWGRGRIRLVFSEQARKKLAQLSALYEEKIRHIENDLAKWLFPKTSFHLTELAFEADDPDMAEEEARDLVDRLIELKLIAEIFVKRGSRELPLAA